MDSNAIKSLIGRKKPLVAECELTLFENCDIVCSFCGHEKESTTGLSREEILSKLPLVEEFLDSIDDDIETVNLHLVCVVLTFGSFREFSDLRLNKIV